MQVLFIVLYNQSGGKFVHCFFKKIVTFIFSFPVSLPLFLKSSVTCWEIICHFYCHYLKVETNHEVIILQSL